MVEQEVDNLGRELFKELKLSVDCAKYWGVWRNYIGEIWYIDYSFDALSLEDMEKVLAFSKKYSVYSPGLRGSPYANVILQLTI